MNRANAESKWGASNTQAAVALGTAQGHSLMDLQPEIAWESARKLAGRARCIRRGRIDCWQGHHYLFGTLTIDEDTYRESHNKAATALQLATEAAYREMFDCLEATGYPHLARVWNYLPRINTVEDSIERYLQFNIGRQDAFLASHRDLTEALPAACALGSRGGKFTIGFLATRQPVQSLENPRQVSAYHYPMDYGPRSPTFARAVLLDNGGEPLLFISGTAAIIGHRSVQPGNAIAQTRETITNLEMMIETANRAVGRSHFSPNNLNYVVPERKAAF